MAHTVFVVHEHPDTVESPRPLQLHPCEASPQEPWQSGRIRDHPSYEYIGCSDDEQEEEQEEGVLQALMEDTSDLKEEPPIQDDCVHLVTLSAAVWVKELRLSDKLTLLSVKIASGYGTIHEEINSIYASSVTADQNPRPLNFHRQLCPSRHNSPAALYLS
eukprot:TRINITY_DN103291_c0_g1_i1.p1 TRINITY_DN103291_c0_g1~~TRINITY_DN103291_c0_g1_i1.p1  ORF type:complete len:161 (+),score=24.27 TRINITY_DN103291_c0_g1_i1:229-711(+)